jgi:hypothetical protein
LSSDLDPKRAVELLPDYVRDPGHGWSIGSFGAVAEFSRAAHEKASLRDDQFLVEAVTDRGAMRIAPDRPLRAIAYETLSGDGRTWGHALSLCVERANQATQVILEQGPDSRSLREEDRGALLFDIGIGCGAVRFCVRTEDPRLIELLRENVGSDLLGNSLLMAQIVRAQPHRVLLSPAGRIEVFQAIPPADGKSPEGPHTHVLPKLIIKRRTHSSNVPIPPGWYPALTLHPKPPWRSMAPSSKVYDAEADAGFAPLLDRFGCPSDREVRAAVTAAVKAGRTVHDFAWPSSRHARIAARVTLRRLAVAEIPASASWRAVRDHLQNAEDVGEEE